MSDATNRESGGCTRCGEPITDRTPPEGVTQAISLTRTVTTWRLRFRRFHWRWLPEDPRGRLRETYTALDLCDWCAGDVFLFAQGLPPRHVPGDSCNEQAVHERITTLLDGRTPI